MKPWATLKNSDASSYISRSSRYWNAAQIIIENQERPIEFMEPVGYLISMSAELSLKAYLFEVGYNDYSHDIYNLIKKCIDRKLELSEEDVIILLSMRQAHEEHFYRYGAQGIGYFNEGSRPFTIVLPDEERSLNVTARLIDIISNDPSVLRSRSLENYSKWKNAYSPLIPVTSSQLEVLIKAAKMHASKIESFGVSHKDLRKRKLQSE